MKNGAILNFDDREILSYSTGDAYPILPRVDEKEALRRFNNFGKDYVLNFFLGPVAGVGVTVFVFWALEFCGVYFENKVVGLLLSFGVMALGVVLSIWFSRTFTARIRGRLYSVVGNPRPLKMEVATGEAEDFQGKPIGVTAKGEDSEQIPIGEWRRKVLFPISSLGFDSYCAKLDENPNSWSGTLDTFSFKF